MTRPVIAIALLAALTSGSPAGASPASRAGHAGEDYAVLGPLARDMARGEELRARSLAAALMERRIAETERAIAAWGADRAGGMGH